MEPSLFQKFRLNHNVTVFEAEESIKPEEILSWFQHNFYKAYYIVAIYLAVIFWGKNVMAKREKFDLRGLLVLWNLGLAIFSIMGAIRVVPNLLHLLMDYEHGFYESVCSTNFMENKVVFYWVTLFAWSKVAELGDTAFIVLRKQPLIFLHWYHHVTVLVFTWYSGAEYSSLGRWYTAMNLVVHSFMYTYYGLKALKWNIPKSVAQAITTMQLTQMIIGNVVPVAAFLYKSSGVGCGTKYSNIAVSLGVYASYWALFANFFYQTYIAKRKPKAGVVDAKKT